MLEFFLINGDSFILVLFGLIIVTHITNEIYKRKVPTNERVPIIIDTIKFSLMLISTPFIFLTAITSGSIFLGILVFTIIISMILLIFSLGSFYGVLEVTGAIDDLLKEEE